LKHLFRAQIKALIHLVRRLSERAITAKITAESSESDEDFRRKAHDTTFTLIPDSGGRGAQHFGALSSPSISHAVEALYAAPDVRFCGKSSSGVKVRFEKIGAGWRALTRLGSELRYPFELMRSGWIL
jgi:hypothetical protein